MRWDVQSSKESIIEISKTKKHGFLRVIFDGGEKQNLFVPFIVHNETTWNERLRYAFANQHEKQADAEY